MLTTRLTLLQRIRDLSDQESWDEFCRLYGPFLLGVLRRSSRVHLDEDALLDVVQQVFVWLTRKIGVFEYDPEKSLRRYLATVAIREAWRCSPRIGSTAEVQEVADKRAGLDALIEDEWRRARLFEAIEKIRRSPRGETDSWRIFERIAIDGESPVDVAADEKKSRGAVDSAKWRAIGWIKGEIGDEDVG